MILVPISHGHVSAIHFEVTPGKECIGTQMKQIWLILIITEAE